MQSKAKPDNFAVTMAGKDSIKITASAGKTVIKIRGFMWSWSVNNAADFEHKIDEAIEAGHTNLDVYINSPGGDPFEGNQFGILLDRFAGVKTCIIESLAASTATMFLGKFDKRECYSTSALMIHEPVGNLSGNAESVEASLKMLKNMRSVMIAEYAKVTGKSEDDIAAMIKSDYWMDAKEAKKLGFITSIRSGKPEPLEMDSIDAALKAGVNIPAPIAASATKPTNQKNDNTMSKILMLAAVLGLSGEDATNEDKIILEANKAIAENKNLKVELSQKDAAIQALKDAEKTKAADRAKAAIEAAVTANKITAAQKETFTKQAEKDPDFVVEILATLAPYVPASTKIESPAATGIQGKMEARKDWNWSKWSREDDKGLAEMKATAPDAYKELYKSEFGKEPKN